MWRQKKNNISKLQDESSAWVEDVENLSMKTMEFFKKLYEADTDLQSDTLLNLFTTKVINDINEKLCKEFT